MVVSDAVTANAHHGLAAHEVVLLLQTDPHRGLTTEVADGITVSIIPAVAGG